MDKIRVELARQLLGGWSSVGGYEGFIANVAKIKETTKVVIRGLIEAMGQAKEAEKEAIAEAKAGRV